MGCGTCVAAGLGELNTCVVSNAQEACHVVKAVMRVMLAHAHDM